VKLDISNLVRQLILVNTSVCTIDYTRFAIERPLVREWPCKSVTHMSMIMEVTSAQNGVCSGHVASLNLGK